MSEVQVSPEGWGLLETGRLRLRLSPTDGWPAGGDWIEARQPGELARFLAAAIGRHRGALSPEELSFVRRHVYVPANGHKIYGLEQWRLWETGAELIPRVVENAARYAAANWAGMSISLAVADKTLVGARSPTEIQAKFSEKDGHWRARLVGRCRRRRVRASPKSGLIVDPSAFWP